MESVFVPLFALFTAVMAGLFAYALLQRSRLGAVVAQLPAARVMRVMTVVVGLILLSQSYAAFNKPGLPQYATVAFNVFWLAFVAISSSRSVRRGGLALGAEGSIPWARIESRDWAWNAKESNWTLLVKLKSGKVKQCDLIEGESKQRAEEAMQQMMGVRG